MKRVAPSLVVALAVSVLGASTARAAGDDADALFRRGRDRLAASDYAEACPLLERSHALDPAEGTLLALALCHEGQGRLVASWNELSSLLRAGTQNPARERMARAAIERVTPGVARLTVQTDAEGELTIDGRPVVEGVEVAVEPGRHEVVLDVAGARAATRSVLMSAGEQCAVTIAARAAPVASNRGETTRVRVAPATARRLPSSAPGWRRPVAIGAGITAGAAIAAGAYFGLRASSAWSTVESKCDPSACRDRSAIEDRRDAKQLAVMSNVAFGVGAGAALGAILLVLLPPSQNVPAVSASLGPGAAALTARGTF